MKFKFGVSNWTFVFEDKEVFINTALKETISYKPDGSIEIEIVNACLLDELIELFVDKKLDYVIQSFHTRNSDNEDAKEESKYSNISIKDIRVLSMHDGCSDISVRMKGIV